jgi:hypothetical protein
MGVPNDTIMIVLPRPDQQPSLPGWISLHTLVLYLHSFSQRFSARGSYAVVLPFWPSIFGVNFHGPMDFGLSPRERGIANLGLRCHRNTIGFPRFLVRQQYPVTKS